MTPTEDEVLLRFLGPSPEVRAKWPSVLGGAQKHAPLAEGRALGDFWGRPGSAQSPVGRKLGRCRGGWRRGAWLMADGRVGLGRPGVQGVGMSAHMRAH